VRGQGQRQTASQSRLGDGRRVAWLGTAAALFTCAPIAIFVAGQFWTSIVLPDQGVHRSQRRLLVFNVACLGTTVNKTCAVKG
jgi:hypothetical protein